MCRCAYQCSSARGEYPQLKVEPILTNVILAVAGQLLQLPYNRAVYGLHARNALSEHSPESPSRYPDRHEVLRCTRPGEVDRDV